MLLLGRGGSRILVRNTTGLRHGGLRTEAKAERKLLYYRNPMGLPDTSPVPKKDAMGMDYVPVYEGEAETGKQLRINLSIDKVQKLGVKSEAAALRELDRTLRVTGRIEINERRTYTIAPKFEGWVEHLYVNTTGQTVSKGQPLFEVYSPELVSAQREYALALQGLASLKDADAEAKAGMQQLADASHARLKNWDIADSPNALGADKSRVTFRAPVTGIVLEKKAVQGMRFMPGETLYQIADLSSLWVIAEVDEQDIGQVRIGSPRTGHGRCLPGSQVRRQGGFHLPDAEQRHAHGASAHRTEQSQRHAQTRHVRQRADRCGQERQSADRADFRRDRQRHTDKWCWCAWQKDVSSRAPSRSAGAATAMLKC